MQNNQHKVQRKILFSTTLVCIGILVVNALATRYSLAVKNVSQSREKQVSAIKTLRIASGACDFTTAPKILMEYSLDNVTFQKAFTVQLKQCFSYVKPSKTVTITKEPEHYVVSVEPGFQQYVGVSGCTNSSSLNSKATGATSAVISVCTLSLQRISGMETIKIQPADQQPVSMSKPASISMGSNTKISHKGTFTLKIFGDASNRVEFTH